MNTNETLDFFKLYPIDVFEAFVTITIIRAIVDKPIDFYWVFKSSLIIGILTYLVRAVNKEYHENLRQVMHYSVGSMIVNNFTNGAI